MFYTLLFSFAAFHFAFRRALVLSGVRIVFSVLRVSAILKLPRTLHAICVSIPKGCSFFSISGTSDPEDSPSAAQMTMTCEYTSNSSKSFVLEYFHE